MNWQKGLICAKEAIFSGIKGKISKGEPLKRHTTFRIGGPAKYFVEPLDIDSLRLLVKSARVYKIPILIIGCGSNLLVSDSGVNGLVIKFSSPSFKKIFFCRGTFIAGAGCLLGQVINYSQRHCLSGMEFLTGIPGTVGGALVMNAGIPHKNIGDLVEDIVVMDYNGKLKALSAREIKFGYRNSNLSKYIVLSARLRLKRKNPEEIKTAIGKYLDSRKNKQELFLPSAGCVFKNHRTRGPAGKLIDMCGLKGRRIGDACVSEKHANFIVNIGHASAADVSALMGLIKKEVKNRFKITLKPEIKIWG